MGLPNSYTMTKHMAECLVADMHAAGALPAAIVRPSIIGCCAYDPAPGYIGNAAGLTSAILAIVSGDYIPLSSNPEPTGSREYTFSSLRLNQAWLQL